MLFFMAIAVLCTYFGVRLRDRWLLVNAVLFVGLAWTPYLVGAWLWGWWLGVGIMAWGVSRWRPPTVSQARSPQLPPVHYAVCRPYHSSAASEDRA